MNLEQLQTALLAAARRHPPSDRVPYAFEQRVMARLRELRPADRLSAWTSGLWRAAASGLALAVLLVGANIAIPDSAPEDADTLSPASLEAAVFAPVESGGEGW
jgi:hypothetical protein